MSEIRANTISDAAGTGPVTLTKQSAAKAWVNYSNDGGITNRASFNLSSITDVGVGNVTLNFTSSMSGAAEYSATGSNANPEYTSFFDTMNATSVSAKQYYADANVYADNYLCSVAIHGDLA